VGSPLNSMFIHSFAALVNVCFTNVLVVGRSCRYIFSAECRVQSTFYVYLICLSASETRSRLELSRLRVARVLCLSR
jgi:hypothetical protein